MTDQEIAALLADIQSAVDSKDLERAISFYHPDVVYIGPAFPGAIEGIEALRATFAAHFEGPQRTRIYLKDIRVRRLSDESFIAYCRVEGNQTIHLSSRHFKGRLSRVFVETDGGPRVIHEHFSLV